jgi:signal transduction histidine kinase
MRPLNTKYALGLISAGSFCIAAQAVLLVVFPGEMPVVIMATAIFFIACFLVVVGIGSFRIQGVAWQALADHLGSELLTLEAISTTRTDYVFAFNDQQELVQASQGLAALFDIPHLNKPEQLIAALSAPAQQDTLRTAIDGLLDAGEEFVQTVSTNSGRTLSVAGRRAVVRQGQPALYVLRLRDITTERAATLQEQRVRSEALQQVESWHNRFDRMALPVWIRRADLSLLWANTAAHQMMGTKPNQNLESEPFSGTLGEDGRWLAEQAQLDQVSRSETAHAIVSGERRLFRVTETPLDPTGMGGESEAAYIGFAVDMTKLEEKEAELKRHIAGNAAVLERLGAAIAIFAADQHLVFYNQAFVDLWGLEEGFLRTEPLFSELLEELRNGRRIAEQADFGEYRRSQQALFTSLLEPTEELQHLPDGRMLRILATPHPFGGIMFVYEDVSRRYELETSYNTLVAVQRETLNNLSEGICVYGADGRLKLFNPAFARIWGLDMPSLDDEPHANEVMARLRPYFNVPDSEWPELLRDMIAIALDRNPNSGRLQRADGSVLDYLGIPLPDGATLHTFLDITDSVRVEKALRESNDALEAADRLKSEFIANITYQLRTPLTAIMGFAEILQNRYFGPLTERQAEYCANIIDAGQRLITLINDILELASIEAGYITLERSEVEIAPMLNGVSQLVADWARQEDLTLTVTCPDDIGKAWIDERRIRQALFNLLSNAIKFTPMGGRVNLAGDVNGSQLIITVSDNGIGISEADRKRIFQRFERANTRTGQAGAGLGLSVVKSIVEMHGGEVQIDSTPNRGTTIRCILPLVTPESLSDNSQAPAQLPAE